MKLSKPVDPTDPVKSLKHWFKELTVEAEGMTTLQYEMIEALLGLRSQGNRDGWANWSEASVEQLDLLRTHLPVGNEAARIRRDLDQIQVSGETEGHFAYDEIDRLPWDLATWCCQHRDWIHLPPGYQFWLDVPQSAVPEVTEDRLSFWSRVSSWWK